MFTREDQAHWKTILKLCSLCVSGKKKKKALILNISLTLLLNSLEIYLM